MSFPPSHPKIISGSAAIRALKQVFVICAHALCGQVIFTCLFARDRLSLHPQIERESYKHCVLLRLTLTMCGVLLQVTMTPSFHPKTEFSFGSVASSLYLMALQYTLHSLECVPTII